MEFEGGRLYLDRESYTLKIHENAVRQPIMLDDEHQKLSEQLEGKWVRFTGRFNFETGALSPNGEFITFNNVEVIGQSDLVKFGESGECL